MTADAGYDGLDEVTINTAAMPAGSAGRPTATKGAVSNHSITITPSVTNTTGYITGSTKTGTSVTVTAAELASGTKSITANGSGIDVVGYESVDVAVPGGVTPTGNINIDHAGVTDVTNYATATVPGASVTPMAFYYEEYDSSNMHISVDSSGTVDAYFYAHDVPSAGLVQTAGWVDTSATSSGYVSVSGSYQLPTQAATTITPTTSAQMAVAAGKWTTGAVTVAAMPTGTAGTPTATKGTVSNHAVTITPSVTNTTGYITGGTKTGTGVSVSASELVSGSQTVTENGTVDVTNLAEVVVAVSGGGSGMQVATKTTTLGAAAASISFSGLSGDPTSFAITTAADLATGASPWKTAAVTFDGTSLNGQIVTNTSNAQASHSTSFTKSYSNGTLTVTGNGTNFQANQYRLVYTYGGNSANLGKGDVQVGSGATSISFTGLSAEPDYFSIVFTSDFGTSSGYQRVMAVVYDGNSTYGVAMDSGAKALSNWSYTYNNGTLTVSSQGTNNGGYFHQPGDYHLTYGIGGTVEPVEIDVQPLSVTQNGTYTAPDGVAYSPVTVNVSGGSGARVATTTWTNSSTSTVSHEFTGLSGTPKAAFLRCTTQLTRSSSNTYYYIADIVWDGTNARGNYHLRSSGAYTDVPSSGTAKYNVTVGTNSITFSSTASSRSSAPGAFYNGTYELVYVY